MRLTVSSILSPKKTTDRPETMTLDRHNGFLKEPVEGIYYIDQLHKVGLSDVHGGIMVVNDILTGDIRIHGDELYFISLEEDSKKNTFAFKTMERKLCRRKNDVSKHNERSKNSTDMFLEW